MFGELFAPFLPMISDWIVRFGYWGIIAITFIENIIAPIPSEFVFPWAGFLASQGKMNIWLISLSGAVGSVAAALVLYYLGSRFNGPKTRQFIEKYGKHIFINLQDLEKAEKWFEKWGIWTVLIFRVVPLGRTIISVPAGFVKMNIFVFSILTFAGTFVWSLVLTYAGFALGENWDVVSKLLGKYENFVIYGIILSFVGFFFLKRKKIPQHRKG